MEMSKSFRRWLMSTLLLAIIITSLSSCSKADINALDFTGYYSGFMTDTNQRTGLLIIIIEDNTITTFDLNKLSIIVDSKISDDGEFSITLENTVFRGRVSKISQYLFGVIESDSNIIGTFNCNIEK